MRAAIFRILILVGALSLALGAAEVGLRLVGYTPAHFNSLRSFHVPDPVIGHRGRPGYEGRFRRYEFDVRVVHDDAGFRRHENGDNAGSCSRRVIVFGDSFTWGWGVDQGQVYTDRLSLLRPDLCVENYGIVASGTVMQHTLFETELLDGLQVGDTVVILSCWNDFDNNVNPWGLHGEVESETVRVVPPNDPLSAPSLFWLKRHSHLVNLATFVGDARRQRRRTNVFLERAERLRPNPDVKGESAEIVVTRHFLEHFRDQCREKGVRFLLLYAAHGRNMNQDALDGVLDPFQAAMHGIADDLDLDFRDLTADFYREQLRTGKPLLFDQDPHWNPEGHAFMGKWLAEELR